MTGQDEARKRLRTAPWLKATPLGKVFAALDADAGTTRVVGGAVRDTLLGRADAGSEIDLATTLLPDQVTARAKAHGIAAIPTGIAFGTVTLAVDDRSFEVTTLRHDVETDGRRAIVRFGDDWQADAQRRDFTLNALYCGPDGELLDPLDGLGDCLAGRVRFIGDADERIAEDRLRVFRFFRFSASHGGEKFDADGLRASTAAADDLGPLSAERIGHEMTRILALRRCAKTLAVMTRSGILAIASAPLADLEHYEQLADAPELAARLAILSGETGLDDLKTRWRLSNAVIAQTATIARAALLVADGKLAEAAYRHPDVLDVACTIASARERFSPDEHADILRELRAFKPPDFPITGAVLIGHGFERGPKLGTLIARLEAIWIDSNFALTRDELIALARQPLN